MLRHLSIRDFAIIDTLELEFGAGFTVLTGETGAGKSILIDALGLLLGDRADSAMVRAGAAQAELSAEFSVAAAGSVGAWLEQHSLSDSDSPDTVLLRRLVSAEGRTRAFVNGSPVPVGSLRELGEFLIEIHGQHEHQKLVRSDAQRALLDDYGRLHEQTRAVSEAAMTHARLERELAAALDQGRQDPARAGYLRHQLDELEALDLKEDEIAQLDAEHRTLSHAGELLQDGAQACDALNGGEDTLSDRLATITGLLEAHAEQLPAFAEAAEMLAAAGIQIDEAASNLRRALDRLELDPARLSAVESRLEIIQDLARKHHVRPAELPALRERLALELAAVENAAGEVGRIDAERAATEKRYRKLADILTLARLKAAKSLSAAITEIARDLGMSQARFVIDISGRGNSRPAVHGDDEIRFDFSANPGQPPRPLAKIASGGELSRISLAVQVAASEIESAPTMIFDEVDSGVGGATAEIVGARLKALGARHQVLCVTHLPQVAAQGRGHFAIRKEVDGRQTYTRVSALDEAARVQELARMLGGREITDPVLANARELLARAAG